MKEVFDAFSADELLRDWHWKGHPLSPEDISKLKDEAKSLKGSFLWKVLKGELQWFAIKSLLERGEGSEDIRIARVFGNIIQEIDKKLDEMSK